jgi:hypothetical protein
MMLIGDRKSSLSSSRHAQPRFRRTHHQLRLKRRLLRLATVTGMGMSYYSDSHNDFFASSPSYRRLSSRRFAHPPLTSARLGSGSLTAAPSPPQLPAPICLSTLDDGTRLGSWGFPFVAPPFQHHPRSQWGFSISYKPTVQASLSLAVCCTPDGGWMGQ